MPLFVCSKLLRNNKVKNYENSLKIGATSVTSEKKPRLFMRSFKGHDNPGCRITEVFQEKNK